MAMAGLRDAIPCGSAVDAASTKPSKPLPPQLSQGLCSSAAPRLGLRGLLRAQQPPHRGCNGTVSTFVLQPSAEAVHGEGAVLRALTAAPPPPPSASLSNGNHNKGNNNNCDNDEEDHNEGRACSMLRATRACCPRPPSCPVPPLPPAPLRSARPRSALRAAGVRAARLRHRRFKAAERAGEAASRVHARTQPQFSEIPALREHRAPLAQPGCCPTSQADT